MNELDLKEIQNIELDMVKYMDGVCQQNKIPYFLLGGSTIGAVRHKGFIPWDDDVDIGIPRSSYKKLRDIVNNDSSPYKLMNYDTVDDYGYSMPKLYDTRTTLIDYKLGSGEERLSVFVDVFILDGVGNGKIGSLVWFYFLYVFKRMVFLSRRNLKMESLPKTIIFFMPWVLCKFIGSKNINKVFNSLAALKKFENKKYIANLSGRYGRREIVKQEYFTEGVKVPFEDTSLYIPAGYDDYLRTVYGDYMKLPPKGKQVTNHLTDAWWNE